MTTVKQSDRFCVFCGDRLIDSRHSPGIFRHEYCGDCAFNDAELTVQQMDALEKLAESSTKNMERDACVWTISGWTMTRGCDKKKVWERIGNFCSRCGKPIKKE